MKILTNNFVSATITVWFGYKSHRKFTNIKGAKQWTRLRLIFQKA